VEEPVPIKKSPNTKLKEMGEELTFEDYNVTRFSDVRFKSFTPPPNVQLSLLNEEQMVPLIKYFQYK
jgi:hypothetical protein